MNFPNYFADAESNFDDAKFVIFGVPYDKTSSFRPGAKNAPKKIRQASWNFETYNLMTGNDLRDVPFHDYGDLDVKNLKPDEMVEKVKDFTKMLLSKNKFPIAIGGEHSITPGIISAFPNDISVLSLDAHIDFRDIYEKQKNNHACATRRISDHIKVNNLAVIGIRSAEKEEFEEAKKQKLLFIDSFKIHQEGIKYAISEVKNYFQNKKIYLTLDIDVIDPAYAPGTSTPEPFGINSFDVLKIIDEFSPNLIGFDLVEVCPDYDNGETSLLAAKIIRYVLEKIYNK